MIRLGWKNKLYAYAAGRLLGSEFLAEEGHVTQWLEMGKSEIVPDFDHAIQDVFLYR